jgi:drug/metabolite transporter (DMT)-like permease
MRPKNSIPAVIEMNNEKRGYVCVVIAAILWASSGTLSKLIFNKGISPLQLVQLRTTLSAALLLVVLVLRKPTFLKIKRKDLGYFVWLGLSLAIAQFTYFFAISKIYVATAILLQYLAPVFIAVYAFAFAKRNISFVMVTAIIGSLFGCYLMVGAYNLDLLGMNRAGIVSGLVSAVAFASYTVTRERGAEHYKPWTLLFYAFLFAACVWNILQPPLSAFFVEYCMSSWLAIFFIGVFGTIFPFALYNEGIRLVGSVRAGITATMEPVIAGIISYFLLKEAMGLWQVAGAVIVIASVASLQIKR